MPRLPALLFACAALAAGTAARAAQTTWLTIMGDPSDAASDVVQIEPESVVVFSNLRTIRIRVSRAHPRKGYDERPYRGFIGAVHIDCANATARYRQLQLFSGPLWTGASRVVNYTDAAMPPMAFRDIEPNPTARIVQAACTIDRVQTK
ncbi:MAG: hypothetical protein KA795_00890 [Burkholderiaceae bacterium]|nr:hypothetical protein [Burkholderiaceae bacterium]